MDFFRIDLIFYFTFLTFISNFISYILSTLWNVLFKPNVEERFIYDEIRQLKTEQQKISIKDEFAAHAKLQRKINKLDDQLKGFKDTRIQKKTKVSYTVMIAIHMLLGLISVSSTIYFKNEPLMAFKQNMFPFETLLSYPSNVPHSISPHSWMIISRVSISTLLAAIPQIKKFYN